METLNCYICHKGVVGGLDGLVRHFRSVHGVSVHRGVGSRGFECGQNGCKRRFYHFYTIRRHIRKVHLNNALNVLSDQEDIVEQYDLGLIDRNENNDVDNNSTEEILEAGSNYDLHTSVVRMVARLQSKSSVTNSIVNEVLDECEEILIETVNQTKHLLQNFLRKKKLSQDKDGVELLQKLQIESPFDGLRSLKQQIEALKKMCKYIEPSEVPLGYRMDSSLDSATSTFVPKMVLETCQYVPIFETLTLLLSNMDVLHAVLSEEPSPDGFLVSYVDGDLFKQNPFLQVHQHTIRIQLYYDELEITGPLGSKTGIHKIGAFYFTVQNIPAHLNSELSSIHVLMLCCDADVKKYGFEKILSPFLTDLAKLESQERVQVHLHGEVLTLRATLVSFCGDTLAVHAVFNFPAPGANKFCRECLYTRSDLHEGKFEPGQERTKEVHAQHLKYIQEHNLSDASMI